MGLHQADQKKVIVNADDFGLSRQINRGIIEAHHAGMLRSASLLANGPAAAEAIEAASGNRGLGVGLHLTLVFGEPVSPKDKVGSLLTRGGEFPRGYPSFVSRYFSGGVRLREVEYEWERQMERGAPAGLSHLDSHQHLHLLPGLFGIAVKLAKKWGIPFIRIPAENIDIGRLGHDYVQSKVLIVFSFGRKRALRQAGLRSSKYFFGSSFGGGLLKPAWIRLIPRLPDGLTEVMCHPGREDEGIRAKYGWTSRWEEELETLFDPEISDTAAKYNIRFTNYKETAGEV